MTKLIASMLDATRLLFDLQRANEIAQNFAGCLDPQAIARHATDGLVSHLDCAFARIWLVEPDQTALRLVASSGLYTRIDGSFARVPMGAYKVGKIAQNRVSFLSNNLPEESWVKDRDWAIANQIRGFAGFPLTIGDRVIGVLATFSHNPLAPEFLEVLQVLCTMASVALDTALQAQQERLQRSSFPTSPKTLTLSDQLATVLGSVRLTLIGTEQPLPLCHTYLFLQVGELLNRLGCHYCRLVYGDEFVVLEAIAAMPHPFSTSDQLGWRSPVGMLVFMATCLGGYLQSDPLPQQNGLQLVLRLPYSQSHFGKPLQISCRLPVLQLAFTQLAYAAGLQVCDSEQLTIPLLTDDLAQLRSDRPILWVQPDHAPIPHGIKAVIPLSTTPDQLRDALNAVTQGNPWNVNSTDDSPTLSEREREILSLLTEGLRDRDIANHLILSESTVKFHMNNIISKLKARTRFQALHQAIKKGWL